MATDKQIAANRLNAQKSTGPRTLAGRHRSRRNAVRHGLAAETVIGIVENADEYRAFEAEIIADCNPSSSVEHALASRLASLLWRLRRASAIESELFQSQVRTMRQRDMDDSSIDCQTSGRAKLPCHQEPPPVGQEKTDTESVHKCFDMSCPPNDAPGCNKFAKPSLAQSFLQLANFDNDAFGRLGRYETFLWRQAAQNISFAKCI